MNRNEPTYYFSEPLHLGNVRVTFSDLKEPNNCEDLSEGWSAVASSVNNYYSFGSLQPGRNWNTDQYRFGFNGKENDNEVKGTGNSVDFGARIYDPRLGRFLSADPLIVQNQEYPELSPYQLASNNHTVPFSSVFEMDYLNAINYDY